ncbi:adenylate kinase-domain-containing protein [Pelagophyceae sp. CCMP2097]|nr:adenylate kinase-domain-containing protein [Pelagophyceae sp. CCMP2097]|mmetsp:Transcript_10806/g.36007  ORF Transcript_10806/g.36007 Transcript_10806/m.36007 type:complete len:240 (-) Transcript_10806:47-766(-)
MWARVLRTLPLLTTLAVRAPQRLQPRLRPRCLTVMASTVAPVAPAKARVLFCLGGPGAGKGTQCERLNAEFGIPHLSAGELLRQERANPDSKDGQIIATCLDEGKIVPVALSLGLLRTAMAASPSQRFIIDGFPRNFDNLAGWDEFMHEFADVDAVLFYDVPPDVMTQRMLKRGETSGRTDDNVKAAEKRIATFRESTLPLISHFEKEGKLLRIAGEKSIEEVWALTKEAVEPFLRKEA